MISFESQAGPPLGQRSLAAVPFHSEHAVATWRSPATARSRVGYPTRAP